MSKPKKTEKLQDLKYQGREWDMGFYRRKVYSGKLESYLDALKITDAEERKKMEDSILSAAMYYENAKRAHLENYAPSGEVERNIEALTTPLETLIRQLEKMNIQGHHEITRAYRNSKSAGTIDKKEVPFMNALFPDGIDKALINPDGLLAFLKSYKASCEAAIENGVSTNAANKGHPLTTWLLNLNHNWQEYSDIEFTAGAHYSGETGYNSDAIHILKDIMEPLDSSVEKQTIANKLIEVNKEAKK